MSKPRPPGWWYPWIFVAAMGVVVAVNGVLVYFALSTWTGLETKDYYVRGLQYNQALAASRDQDARGWQARLSFDAVGEPAGGERQGTLSVVFTDRDGAPLEDLSVTAMLVRPTHEGHDATVTLEHQGDGLYAGVVRVALAGQWDARILAHRGDGTFQTRQRLFLP